MNSDFKILPPDKQLLENESICSLDSKLIEINVSEIPISFVIEKVL